MIILIDPEEFIPKTCSECRCFFRDNKCLALEKAIEDVSRRFPGCPMKYLPGRMQRIHGPFQSLEEAYRGGLNDGWNSCIDSMERD